MKKFNGINPNYVTVGVSTKGNLESLLDTRAMYKSPEKAKPKLVALTTDYPDDAKYLVGKKINLDATFTYRLRTQDLERVKWEFSPKNVLVEKMATMPDPKTIRRTYVPVKHGHVQVKVTYTNDKKEETVQTLMLEIEKTTVPCTPLSTTKIVSFLFTDPTIQEIQVGQELELRLVFDRIVPETEIVSIIHSDNLKTAKGLEYAVDRKSGIIKFTAIEGGYAYIKAGTTGTPYIGFSDLEIIQPEEELKLMSISEPLDVVKGETVECVLTFNNYLLEMPKDLKVTLNNANVKELSRKLEGKTVKITYQGAVEGATKITAQLGEGSPSSECQLTTQKEATTINTANVDKPEVTSGENIMVTLEFDEYPIQSKVKINAGSQSSFTKKGKVIVEGKTAKQEFISNTPGRHKINASYGESTKEVDVFIKGKTPSKKAE